MLERGSLILIVLIAIWSPPATFAAQEFSVVRGAGAVLVLPDGRMAIIAGGPQDLTVVQGMTKAGAEAGEPVDLRVGDQIVRFQKTDAPAVEAIASMYDGLEVGAEVTLVIRREGAERTLTFKRPPLPAGTRTVVTRPGDAGAGAWVGGGGSASTASLIIAGIHIKENDQGMPEVTHRTSHPASTGIDLRSGDVIVTIQGHPIAALAGLERGYGRIAAGSEVLLAVTRDGAPVNVRFAKPTEP